MKKMTNVEIKETIFQIFLKFAEYCDGKGLRYYMCGGTLLGAVRHKDFIPWDDDIDVFMPRPDYIWLHEFLKEESIGEYYQLKSNIYGNSPFSFAKIVDVQTEAVAKYNTIDNTLWIDIFPLDGVPFDYRESQKFLKKARWWRRIFGYSVTKFGIGTTKWRMIIKTPVLLVAFLIGHKRCVKKIDQMANAYSFDESEYIAFVGDIALVRMRKSEYVEYVEMEFHGHMFHAPSSWDQYLKDVYGNYMELPPENKRCAHSIEAYKKEEEKNNENKE